MKRRKAFEGFQNGKPKPRQHTFERKLHPTMVYLYPRQYQLLRGVWLDLQQGDLVNVSQSDIVRCAIEKFLEGWTSSKDSPRRKAVIGAILSQEHYQKEGKQ